MKLQSEQFAGVFAHLRDTAKGYTKQDVADLAQIRADMPPSKAHLKRLQRHAVGKVHVDPVKVRTAKQIATRKQSDYNQNWFKQQIAGLGGSRTIAATTEGELYNVRANGLLTFIEPNSKVELTDPKSQLFNQRKGLYLRQRTEEAKMLYTECPMQSLFDYSEFGPAL